MSTRTRIKNSGLRGLGIRMAGVFVSVAMMPAVAAAQDLGIKAPAQDKPIAITNAVVHTISGQTIQSGYVIFDKGKIIGVGENSALPRLTSDVQMIDAAGKHIYPGMIAPYTQLGLTEIATIRASNDMSEVGSNGVSPEVLGAVGVNPDSTLIPVTRSNGILAAGIFPTGGTISGRASVLVMDGWTYEDMTVKPDAGLIVNWPMSRPITAWWMDTPEEEQLKNIRQNMQRIEDTFSLAQAYRLARRADPATPIDLRWDAMMNVFPPQSQDAGAGAEASGGLAGAAIRGAADGAVVGAIVGATAQSSVFIMAQDYDQITSAVEFCNRMDLRCVIVGGRESPQAADILKRHNVPVILIGTHVMPRRDDSAFDEPFTVPMKLEKAGVKWCLANGDDTPHERNLPYSAGRAVAYGLDVDAAIRALTLSAAEILGVADSLGSIDPGKSATLIVTDGNPLELTTKLDMAFVHGKRIDLSNKHTELDKKYREKYRQQRAAEKR